MTTEEFIEYIAADGVADDEYVVDGMPYCKKCNGARYFLSPDKTQAIRVNCQCIIDELNLQKENARRLKVKEEFERRQRLSLIGDRYKDVSFDTSKITFSNKGAYDKCKSYVAKSEQVLKHNIGLYIYGPNSTGKTHLSACICNELVRQGYYCVYTNLAYIVSDFKVSMKSGISETALLQRLQAYDFVFIDDVGKEFIGRDYNLSSSKWIEEKFFEIINARYNANKPTIFSSNYSIAELASKLYIDKGIIERINEMSTMFVRLDKGNFRMQIVEEKNLIASEVKVFS